MEVKTIKFGDTIVTIKGKKRDGRTHYSVKNNKYDSIFEGTILEQELKNNVNLLKRWS